MEKNTKEFYRDHEPAFSGTMGAWIDHVRKELRKLRDDDGFMRKCSKEYMEQDKHQEDLARQIITRQVAEILDKFEGGEYARERKEALKQDVV